MGFTRLGMNEHFCYALVEDLAVRYVGYTARQLDRRRIEHRRKHPDWHFLLLGAYPSRAIGLEQENWWIKRLHNAGYTLTNIAEGGTGGITGLKTSYLTRAKMSAAQKARWTRKRMAEDAKDDQG